MKTRCSLNPPNSNDITNSNYNGIISIENQEPPISKEKSGKIAALLAAIYDRNVEKSFNLFSQLSPALLRRLKRSRVMALLKLQAKNCDGQTASESIHMILEKVNYARQVMDPLDRYRPINIADGYISAMIKAVYNSYRYPYPYAFNPKDVYVIQRDLCKQGCYPSPKVYAEMIEFFACNHLPSEARRCLKIYNDYFGIDVELYKYLILRMLREGHFKVAVQLFQDMLKLNHLPSYEFAIEFWHVTKGLPWARESIKEVVNSEDLNSQAKLFMKRIWQVYEIRYNKGYITDIDDIINFSKEELDILVVSLIQREKENISDNFQLSSLYLIFEIFSEIWKRGKIPYRRVYKEFSELFISLSHCLSRSDLAHLFERFMGHVFESQRPLETLFDQGDIHKLFIVATRARSHSVFKVLYTRVDACTYPWTLKDEGLIVRASQMALRGHDNHFVLVLYQDWIARGYPPSMKLIDVVLATKPNSRFVEEIIKVILAHGMELSRELQEEYERIVNSM